MKKAYILFTRIPESGTTKTRLMPYLKGEECKELALAFLNDLNFRLKGLNGDIFVFYTPEYDEKVARKIFQGAKGYFVQEGKDIGERMKNGIFSILKKGYEMVLLSGSDIPILSKEIIEDSFKILEKSDILINPSEDGGYYLIGMKKPYNIFDVKNYGKSTVFESTITNCKEKNLTVGIGEKLFDIDTKEDLDLLFEKIKNNEFFLPFTEVFLLKKQCINCDICKKNCIFLQKYGINIGGLSQREDLAYNCFLCGKCKEVCPKSIDGRRIAFLMRVENLIKNKKIGIEYNLLKLEKDSYIFSNYKMAKGKSVLFTGCNFPSYYPKITKYLVEILKKESIGVVHDCCSNPIYNLGLIENSKKAIDKIQEKLKKENVKEIIFLCPNCYYFLKDRMDFKMVTIFEKLRNLGLGNIINEKLPYYSPCPDREDKIFKKDIEYFVKLEEPLKDLQCCGLGGCAFLKEKELAKVLREKGENTMVYTSCASCASRFKKGNSKHILTKILDYDEEISEGLKTLVNRGMWKFKNNEKY